MDLRRGWGRAGGGTASVLAGVTVFATSVVATEAILPPGRPWAGASRGVVARAGDPWRTPCEASGFTRTPGYDDTMAWLERLCATTPDLRRVALGTSGEGRTIWMVVAARGAASHTVSSVRALGRPIVFVQAGIHAGEIDGKDAGLMLLRDLAADPQRRLYDLLDSVSLVFVPIFNVDGHERSGRYARINQRGPSECGWRTTATNLNLNRDYAKVDTPEMRAMIAALVAWDPDLYIDLHVTDGGDHQYDVTWGANGAGGWSPAIRAWNDATLTPALETALARNGHVPGPFVFPQDDDDWSRGMVVPTMNPRLSNGYGDARHLPTILVENHSLKPYEQRVLGTYVFLEAALRTVGRDAAQLRHAVAADRSRREAEVTLDWKVAEPATPRSIDWLGIASRSVPSAVSGGTRVEWLGRPETVRMPLLDMNQPKVRVTRPQAYWIPPAWSEIGARLVAHGIAVEPQAEARTLDVEIVRIVSARFDTVAYEGRVRVTPAVMRERQRRTFAAGSIRVPTDQPLGDLAILLLEPEASDSYFQWGFFHAVLQRTEYAEAYILEPMAERMLAADARLRAEFERRVRDDPAFAASPAQRLDWFYRRTPYYDTEAGLYPLARE
jgi:murein tripeptide amidase MpaA